MELGIVARDPYYDYGSYPGRPMEPNRAAQERMCSHLAVLGAKWLRVELHWGADGQTDLAGYDYLITTLAPRYGLKVLVVLGFGLTATIDPRMLAHGPAGDDKDFGGGVTPAMAVWLRRAMIAVGRWRDAVHAYEILNEQNRLPPDGVAVPVTIAARMHAKFYRLLTAEARLWAARPRVILGGLHPAGSNQPFIPGWVRDTDYLRGYFKSDPFQQWFFTHGRYPLDGIGYHPYPHEITASLEPTLRGGSGTHLIAQRMAEVARVRDEFDSRVPFWITEIGYNAGYPRQSREGQAMFLSDVAEVLRRRADVETMFWFKYEDFPPATGPDAQRWGVVTIPFAMSPEARGGAAYDWNAEPQQHRAWQAFQAVARSQR